MRGFCRKEGGCDVLLNLKDNLNSNEKENIWKEKNRIPIIDY